MIIERPTDAGLDADITGRLSLEAGCLILHRAVVVWPSSARWNGHRRSVVISGWTEEVRVGTRVELGGGMLSLSAGFPDLVGKAARAQIRACGAATGAVRYWLTAPQDPTV